MLIIHLISSSNMNIEEKKRKPPSDNEDFLLSRTTTRLMKNKFFFSFLRATIFQSKINEETMYALDCRLFAHSIRISSSFFGTAVKEKEYRTWLQKMLITNIVSKDSHRRETHLTNRSRSNRIANKETCAECWIVCVLILEKCH